MFYCNDCAEKNNWDRTLSKSGGRCEICNKHVICNDTKPDAPDKDQMDSVAIAFMETDQGKIILEAIAKKMAEKMIEEFNRDRPTPPDNYRGSLGDIQDD